MRLLNACFAALLVSEFVLLFSIVNGGADATHTTLVLLLIAGSLALAAALNWLIAQLGLVPAEAQRAALGLGTAAAPGSGDAAAEKKRE